MADINAANVSPGTGAIIDYKACGEAITQGNVVYLKSDGKVWLADADASVTTAAAYGIALATTTAANQVLGVLCGGNLTSSGTPFTVGEIYVLSGTAGGIAPEADLASNDWVTVLGIGTATNTLKVNIVVSGVQVP